MLIYLDTTPLNPAENNFHALRTVFSIKTKALGEYAFN